jgi:S1-C subfamily serine protease
MHARIVQGCSQGPQIVARMCGGPRVAIPARSHANAGNSGVPADAHPRITRADLLHAGKVLALAQLGGFLPLRSAEALTQDENNLIRMFQRNKSSVVFITNLTLRRDAYTMNQMEIPQGAGSGIVWPSRDGQDGTIVVTNYHVVRGSNELMVKLNEGEESLATILGVDEDKDIAVLKLAKPIEGMRPVTLAQSADSLQVGQSAYAIGNPFGLDHTLTSGVISGLGREISSQATGRPITDVIQTDCSIIREIRAGRFYHRMASSSESTRRYIQARACRVAWGSPST